MNIRSVSRKNRLETMYVFQFVDEEEFNFYCEHLESAVKQSNCSDEDADLALGALHRLAARVDDKYANDSCQLSGCMFADEFARFTKGLSLCLLLR
jgi:hypothetical protein